MFNLEESKTNYETFANIMKTLEQKTFDDLQSNIKYYNSFLEEVDTTNEQKEFCNQRIAECTKQYEKNKRKIKEFYSYFADILLNN